MSMQQSTKKQIEQQQSGVDKKGNPVISKIKIIQRNYPCRPQVIDRRQNWVKFGIAKNFKRGQNVPGLRTIGDRVKFMADDGQDLNQQIQIAKNLIQFGKQNQMAKKTNR